MLESVILVNKIMKSLIYEAVNTYIVMHTVYKMYKCVYSN